MEGTGGAETTSFNAAAAIMGAPTEGSDTEERSTGTPRTAPEEASLAEGPYTEVTLVTAGATVTFETRIAIVDIKVSIFSSITFCLSSTAFCQMIGSVIPAFGVREVSIVKSIADFDTGEAFGRFLEKPRFSVFTLTNDLLFFFHIKVFFQK
jgi:hypothetical protein